MEAEFRVNPYAWKGGQRTVFMNKRESCEATVGIELAAVASGNVCSTK